MLFDGRTGPSKPPAPSGANRVFRKNLGQGFGEFPIKNGNIGGASHVRNSKAERIPYHIRNIPVSAAVLVLVAGLTGGKPRLLALALVGEVLTPFAALR